LPAAEDHTACLQVLIKQVHRAPVEVFGKGRQNYRIIGTLSYLESPPFDGTMPGDDIFAANVVLDLGTLQRQKHLLELVSDVTEPFLRDRIALIHPRGGGWFDHDNPVDLLALRHNQRQSGEVLG
jgi:hypothetical protein